MLFKNSMGKNIIIIQGLNNPECIKAEQSFYFYNLNLPFLANTLFTIFTTYMYKIQISSHLTIVHQHKILI